MQPRNSRPRSCRQLSPACRTSSKNSTWWGKRCAAWSTAKQLGSNDVHQTGSEECASPINSLITLPSLNIYTVRIIYIYLLLHPPPHYITYCPNSIYIYIIIYIHIYIDFSQDSWYSFGADVSRHSQQMQTRTDRWAVARQAWLTRLRQAGVPFSWCWLCCSDS